MTDETLTPEQLTPEQLAEVQRAELAELRKVNPFEWSRRVNASPPGPLPMAMGDDVRANHDALKRINPVLAARYAVAHRLFK